ncbi:hypothetical protein PB1_16274 [Bacillus methanolicus PB1]|uniref:Uncharacterized protein n=1 Tax=Bacillus methanolicus PB1 TaxID=997296 RepID=I3DY09_BACMT|nr:hypothetical protein [Bacillus methanolicus]EIJ79130.1 hypothetical protein PB1_16274 [Bacillus methanolicus PB1]
MNPFAKEITDLIKKYISDGMSKKEALESVGAKKWSGDNIYYIPYGLYEDKVLLIKVD